MTYIKELIDLPDSVRQGDYVLRLAEGITHPKETVEQYVVTPQLEKCFEEGLNFIRSAVAENRSKGAYLKGSFGSGKSHYMAILCLILQGNPEARAIPELAKVVAKHSAWTEGKNFLLVPFHFLNAKNVESAILGGYVDFIHRLHPHAPTPGVFLADKILQDAEKLRQKMGDETFFGALTSHSTKGSPTGPAKGGWGKMEKVWNAERYTAGVKALPKSRERGDLVSCLVDTFFSAMSAAGEFVDLDTGLSLLSQHAQGLGYHGVVLFLDELILWLATKGGDMNFINNEGQKLVKLVEYQVADRPVPLISFIARQRDLRLLVEDQHTGQESLRFSTTFDHYEARFHPINLEDRNLPAIAEKRLLAPKNETARQLIDEAFRKTTAVRQEVLDILMTSQGKPEEFRKTYPFSPALIDTLVEVSFLLQRERTAIKVMMKLLVEQRDTLKLGDLVPVGDIFELIAEGDEAFHEKIRVDFDNAKRLYQQKFYPLLEHIHQLRFEDMAHLPYDDPKAMALRNDDRLVKTLLIAALAPNLESFKNLTPAKLAALNHGTIKSPIPGKEAGIVLAKCKRWAGEIGQLKIGDQPNQPVISLQLTGVDTDGILAQVAGEDNHGNRIQKIRKLLFSEAGIKDSDQPQLHALQHSFYWRGTKRYCEILVNNVRELNVDDSFIPPGDDWRIIIDYPFDDGHTPREDAERLERFREVPGKTAKTIVWLPLFLSQQSRHELARLVKLDFLLQGERLSSYVKHLSVADRAAAKTILENQQSQLKQRMVTTLEGVYGISTPGKETVDTTSDLTLVEQFQTLEPGFRLQPPVAANFEAALQNLLDQALSHQFPAHPMFEEVVSLTPTVLKRVFGHLVLAMQDANGRATIEKEYRKELRQFVNPLKLADMTGDGHLVLDNHWKNHFIRKESQYGGPLTVGKLRQWMDDPKPMGLPVELQNLVIHTFARQANHSFFLHGVPFEAPLDKLPDETELRQETLPVAEHWDLALERGKALFGVKTSKLCNAINHTTFVRDIKEKATQSKAQVSDIQTKVQQACLVLKVNDSPRLKTITALKNLMDGIVGSDAKKTVETLATAGLETSEAAMAAVLAKLPELTKALGQFEWDIFHSIWKLQDERKVPAEGIIEQLAERFQKDEHVLPLTQKIEELRKKALQLLTQAPPPPVAPVPVVQVHAPVVQAPPVSFAPLPPVPVKPLTATVPAPVPARAVLQVSAPPASGSTECTSVEEVATLTETLCQRLLEGGAARIRISWEVIDE
ncbi:MAG: phage resistance protein [Blastocatellia bacterium]|nr:phage resistance protein [Blastocatellia bacterium]